MRVHIENLPGHLDGFTIALATDVHVGPTVGRERVEEIVRTLNTLDADIVAIVGDLGWSIFNCWPEQKTQSYNNCLLPFSRWLRQESR